MKHESKKVKVLIAQLCPALCDLTDYSPGFSVLDFLQGIFLTQRSNLGVLHCRQILYHLRHQRSSHLKHTLLYNLIFSFSSCCQYA